jgi:hypothetical protein
VRVDNDRAPMNLQRALPELLVAWLLRLNHRGKQKQAN